jgi:hypothetical protein
MRIHAVLLTLLFAVPAHAGLFDFISLPGGKSDVSADVAAKRVREYAKDVLGLKGFQITEPRGELTSAEKKTLDRHLTSRIDRAKHVAVANVSSPQGKGILVIGATNLTEDAWDPTKGYMAYLSMDTELVFPADADRALSLVVHLVGEPPLFGFAPEGGPLWKVTERYLSSRGLGNPTGGPGGAGQFAGGTPEYQVQSGETAPEADEIPAWVVRGLHDLKWKGGKATEMGLLVALTRRPNTGLCRLTHVTGIGTLGKTLFKDAQRLKGNDE